MLKSTTGRPGAKPTWIKDELGKTGYYEKRAKDFEERNPGRKAPGYYREYGDKYVKRFDKLKPELSKEGQKWVEKTKDLLQLKMETGLRTGEWDESEPEKMEEKAFDSHSEAYSEGGLSHVSATDVVKIALEVDLKDAFTKKAIKEALEVAPDGIEAISNDIQGEMTDLSKEAKKKLQWLFD